MRRICIEFEPSVYILLAAALLLVPLPWILSAVVAAVVHELGHCAAIRLTGGNILRLSVGAGGTVIETEPMERGQEFLCAIAGPAASFLLLFLSKLLPGVAACALLHGLFNLLPVYPLDGGRMMRCILSQRWSAAIEYAVLFLLSGVEIILLLRGAGVIPMILALIVAARAFHRKFPCKAGKIGVQ